MDFIELHMFAIGPLVARHEVCYGYRSSLGFKYGLQHVGVIQIRLTGFEGRIRFYTKPATFLIV